MTEHQVLDLLRIFLWEAVWIGAPIIIVALITGLFIGLFQALTSVQEMSLTFAPKLIAMLFTFWISASFMTRRLLGLFENHVLPLIAAG